MKRELNYVVVILCNYLHTIIPQITCKMWEGPIKYSQQIIFNRKRISHIISLRNLIHYESLIRIFDRKLKKYDKIIQRIKLYE